MLTLSKPQAHSYDNKSDEVIGYNSLAAVELLLGTGIPLGVITATYNHFLTHGSWEARIRTEEFFNGASLYKRVETWDQCVSDFWATDCSPIGDKKNEDSSIYGPI